PPPFRKSRDYSRRVQKHMQSSKMANRNREPVHLFGVGGLVKELRDMAFAIGEREGVPSMVFEAGGRNFKHACQEVALEAIGELCHRYTARLRNTAYRYHPFRTHNDEYDSYQNLGAENSATTQRLVRMLMKEYA
ncbi:hypothetical protein E2562_020535, partial [Oryza meyeriana var. granulata]